MQGKTEALLIPGPLGNLEAEVFIPSAPSSYLFVMCHPHPLFQGSMDNKVVTTIIRAMNELNCVTLRFNYRGVGQSAGSYGEGSGEIADTLAVVTYLRSRFLAQTHLLLGGFSFGGYVAYHAAIQTAPEALLLCAPSVVHGDLNTDIEPQGRMLIIQGAQDEIVPAALVYEWLKTRRHSFTLQQLRETSHFFHGKLMLLRTLSQNFVREVMDAAL